MKSRFDRTLEKRLHPKVKKKSTYDWQYKLLYPLAWCIAQCQMFYEKHDLKWNEKRVIRFLNYAVPKRLVCDKVNKTWFMPVPVQHTSWKNRFWVSWAKKYDEKFVTLYRCEIGKYFIEEYQVPGYEKTIEHLVNNEEEIIVNFKKKDIS